MSFPERGEVAEHFHEFGRIDKEECCDSIRRRNGVLMALTLIIALSGASIVNLAQRFDLILSVPVVESAPGKAPTWSN
jgi:hypothetical protein